VLEIVDREMGRRCAKRRGGLYSRFRTVNAMIRPVISADGAGAAGARQ